MACLVDSGAVAMKPIAYVRSPFLFKNGTPRQPTVCRQARGIITIEKSVFNNPEHSLEGLQDFTHVWILFIFHQNNNTYTKAKVKPPRLNGRRVGLFSTRSPYRPNNVGLTLAKIENITGATLTVSGIDIIDGTPVIDIKPYIPQYDCPTAIKPQDTTTPNDEIDHSATEVLAEHEDEDEAGGIEGKRTKVTTEDFELVSEVDGGLKSISGGLSVEGRVSDNINICVSNDDNDCDTLFRTINRDDSANTVSTIEGSIPSNNMADKMFSETECEKRHFNDKKNDSVEDTQQNIKVSDEALEDTKLKESFSESDTVKAVESLMIMDDRNKDYPENVSKDQGNRLYTKVDSKESDALEEGTENEHIKSSKPVGKTAGWIDKPPIQSLDVRFTQTALTQLEKFSLSDPASDLFKLRFLKDSAEAKDAICNILHEDPRSTYRRKHCADSLYYFTLDVIHVTCWFDVDTTCTVEVVRVKPAVLVNQCKHKFNL